MKVLVTGGNGFLASNVIRELNRRRIEVRAMVRKASDMRSLAGVDCELYQGNLVNREDVLHATDRCDVVVHAAADTSQHYRHYSDYIPVNITGTQYVLEASVQCHVKKLIFVSSANTFGFGTITNPGTEEMPAKYPFTGSGYALSKIRAQEMVLEYARNHNLQASVVNPSFMIGPYDAKPSSGRIITMNYGKRIAFIPPGGKNFIHVGDVATGICNAIDLARQGECYLLVHENLTFSEFYTKIQTVTGKRQHHILLPKRLVTTLGLLGDLPGRLGFRTNLNPINASMLCVGNYYSAAKAVKYLNLPQTPVEQAITDALEWFAQNGYL